MRRVGPVRIPRGSEEETSIANKRPEKAALHGAAASSQSKGQATKDEAKLANPKPDDVGRIPFNAGNKNDTGKKSR